MTRMQDPADKGYRIDRRSFMTYTAQVAGAAAASALMPGALSRSFVDAANGTTAIGTAEALPNVRHRRGLARSGLRGG